MGFLLEGPINLKPRHEQRRRGQWAVLRERHRYRNREATALPQVLESCVWTMNVGSHRALGQGL